MESDTPQDGMIFAVSECTNRDGYGSWLRFFSSRSAAAAFYLYIEEKADQHGGLYPREGVREVSLDEAERMRANERAWIDELQSESESEEDEDEEEAESESEEDDDMYFDGDDVDEDGEGENDSFALLCDEEDEDEE